MSREDSSDKIIRFRPKGQFNFVSVVFILILIYLAAQIVRSSSEAHLEIFTIGEALAAETRTTYRGVITRDETVYTTTSTGYVNYYVAEGKKTSANSPVYVADTTGAFNILIASAILDGTVMDDKKQEELQALLVKASEAGVSGDLSGTEADKAASSALISDAYRLKAVESITDDTAASLHPVITQQSGYILFDQDSLLGLTADLVSEDTFQENVLTSEQYISGEYRSAGSFAYRLVPDDTFSVTFRISEEDARRYDSRKYLSMELVGTGITVNGSFSIRETDGIRYATCTFSKYGSQYLKTRFCDIRINEDLDTGLQIPVTAVTEKSFLLIPTAYIQNGVILKEDLDTGNIERIQNFSIYATTGTYYYVLCSALSQGDYLVSPSGASEQFSEDGSVTTTYAGDRYLVSLMAPLKGVYNVNKGYCIFRQVEILNTTTDGSYYLIATGTSYGLRSRDRIILDASTVTESQII